MANINSVNGIALGGQTASITLPSLTAFNDKYGTYDNKVTHPDDMEMFRVDAGGQNNVQQVVPRKVSWLDKIIRFFKYMFSTDTTMKATSRAFFDDVSRMFNGHIPPKVMNAMGKHCKEDGVEKPVLLSQVRRIQSLASQALDEAQMQAIMDNPEYRYEMMHEQYIEGMTNEQKTDYIKTEKENEAYQKKDFGVNDPVIYKNPNATIKQVVTENGFLNNGVPVDKNAPDNKEKNPGNKKGDVQLSKTVKNHVDELDLSGDLNMNKKTEITNVYAMKFGTTNKDINKQQVTQNEVENLKKSEDNDYLDSNYNPNTSMLDYNERVAEESNSEESISEDYQTTTKD